MQHCWLLQVILAMARVVDPYSFFADPDLAVFLMRIRIQLLSQCESSFKNFVLHYKELAVVKSQNKKKSAQK